MKTQILASTVTLLMALTVGACDVHSRREFHFNNSHTYTSNDNGHVVKLVSDTVADFRPNANGATIQFGDQKIDVTRTKVVHANGQTITLPSGTDSVLLTRSGQVIKVETKGTNVGRIQLP
jgi:hypothetical protein